MTTYFDTLSEDQQRELLRFPVYITLLAANSDGKLDAAEKKSAIKFSHIKTYSSDPLLRDYYEEADSVLEDEIEKINAALPQDIQQRQTILENKLAALEGLIVLLDTEYAAAMRRSMKSFTEHVSMAHHNVLQDFLFPFELK